jgi:hypothetical protein
MAMFGLAGLAAFAGTCAVTHISLVSTDGSHKTFAGQLDNTSGVNILQHNFVIAFLDSSNNVVQTTTVPGCLRSAQNGSTDFFSAVSTAAASGVSTGLARIAFDSTFKVGTTSSQNVSISSVAASRNTTTLTVSGKVTNNAGSTLVSPDVCIVVRDSADNVLITATNSSMSSLAAAANNTFSSSITVPNDSSASSVDIWVDGLDSANNPTTPQQALNTSITVGTATPSKTSTPVGTATPNATPGPASKLGFTTQPSASSAEAAAFAAQPVVKIQDANGITVTTGAASTASVTLAVTVGTGFGGGGAIACTANPVVAVAGIATFAGCNIPKSGIGYTLLATSVPVLSSATSSPFNITPNAGTLTLAFTTQPGGGTGGLAWGTQPVVTVRSAAGGLFWTGTGSAGNVTLAMGTNPSAGTLTCTAATVAAVNGYAAFAGCNINKIGTGYTVTAALDNPVIGATASGLFNITLGAAAKLAINQPSNALSGVAFGTQPIVTVQDAGGNTVTTSTASITLSASTGTLACTNAGNLTMAAAAGVATLFTGCNIVGPGTTPTITAASSGLTSAVTTAITIT